jgi:hypothetical protein
LFDRSFYFILYHLDNIACFSFCNSSGFLRAEDKSWHRDAVHSGARECTSQVFNVLISFFAIKWLFRRELEFEFGINRKLLLDNLYFHSQFRRKRAYFLVSDAVFKGSLIVAYSGFFKLSDDPNESLGSLGKLISSAIIFSILFVKVDHVVKLYLTNFLLSSSTTYTTSRSERFC